MTWEELDNESENKKRLRVGQAASWLDVRYPGWAERVDPDDLLMLSGSRCVAGQLGKDWRVMKKEFVADTGLNGDALFAHYDELWREAINSRRVVLASV